MRNLASNRRRNRGIATMTIVMIAASLLMVGIQFWPKIKSMFSSKSAKEETTKSTSSKATVAAPVQYAPKAPKQTTPAVAPKAAVDSNLAQRLRDYKEAHKEMVKVLSTPGVTKVQREAAYRKYQVALKAYRGR